MLHFGSLHILVNFLKFFHLHYFTMDTYIQASNGQTSLPQMCTQSLRRKSVCVCVLSSKVRQQEQGTTRQIEEKLQTRLAVSFSLSVEQSNIFYVWFIKPAVTIWWDLLSIVVQEWVEEKKFSLLLKLVWVVLYILSFKKPENIMNYLIFGRPIRHSYWLAS